MSRIWKAPRMWAGQTAFILGGGPSLIGADLCQGPLEEVLKNRRTIGVNTAYKLGDWVDICYFGDTNWFRWNFKELAEFGGIKVTSNPNFITDKQFWGHNILCMARNKPQGIETKRGHIAWNGSSGASAINLAYHFGAAKVVLLGFDMKHSEYNHNWHKEHRSGQMKNPKKYDPYDRFLKHFDKIKKDADELGLVIVNATPDSGLKIFPMVTLEEALK